MDSIFDRLRNHAKYVDKTMAKINNDFTNVNSEITDEDINNLIDPSLEDDLDKLLAAVSQENVALEKFKSETDDIINSIVKQLEFIETVFIDSSVSNSSEIELHETIDSSIELQSYENEEIRENISVENIGVNDALNSSYAHLYRYLEEFKLNESSENV